MKLFTYMCLLLLGLSPEVFSQQKAMHHIPAEVNFDVKLQAWDGFGFNYVQAYQTRDYDKTPEDYGGFSLLSDTKKKEVLDMVFGEDGLRVQLVKMFLDPFHQTAPGADFTHERSTKFMRYFVKEGLKRNQARGDKLEIITTLYGPPAWASQQKVFSGRDLDPKQTQNLCTYMVDWVNYLKKNDFPVKYLSIHNEGEDFYRWDFDKGTQRLVEFDYNMYWPPAQVNTFLKELPATLRKYNISDVGVTNGEPSNWTRFYYWGYTKGLLQDKEALDNLSLLTTHGFINGNRDRLSYATADALTTTALRQQKPGLHAWITSYSWGEMGNDFLRMSHENIYTAKANALIPWAGIQTPEKRIAGSSNSGSAFHVSPDGTYEVKKGYYFYKQLTRAGYRGMAVAQAFVPNPQAFIIAFAKNNTKHPDAFVLSSNIRVWSLPLKIKLTGTKSTSFRAYRSSEDGQEKFKDIGVFTLEDGAIIYDPPAGTTTTFIGVE